MAGENLLEYLVDRASKDPDYRAVVLAHPCSGTTWLTDVLANAGVPAIHELLRPASDPDWRVLVTYRQLGWSLPCSERLALVRDPIRTLSSAATLFVQRPRVARDVYAQICGAGFTVGNPQLGSYGPLFLAGLTLRAFDSKLLQRRLPLFRIEDARERAAAWVPEDAPLPERPRRNSHTRGRPAEGLRARDLEPTLLADLCLIRRGLGYPGVSPDLLL